MKILRWAALDELIDESILRIKTRVNREEAPVSDAEIDVEVKQFEKRFPAAAALNEALAAQGIDAAYRLADLSAEHGQVGEAQYQVGAIGSLGDAHGVEKG